MPRSDFIEADRAASREKDRTVAGDTPPPLGVVRVNVRRCGPAGFGLWGRDLQKYGLPVLTLFLKELRAVRRHAFVFEIVALL